MTRVRAWAITCFYYQSRIPMKDAAFRSRAEDPNLRRAWRRRIDDHDGGLEEGGGLRRWLKLAEAVDSIPIMSPRPVRSRRNAFRGRCLWFLRPREANV